jgi:hypothetical protein
MPLTPRHSASTRAASLASKGGTEKDAQTRPDGEEPTKNPGPSSGPGSILCRLGNRPCLSIGTGAKSRNHRVRRGEAYRSRRARPLNSQRSVGIGWASGAAFSSSAIAGTLTAIETGAATSLLIDVIRVSSGAPDRRQYDQSRMTKGASAPGSSAAVIGPRTVERTDRVGITRRHHRTAVVVARGYIG